MSHYALGKQSSLCEIQDHVHRQLHFSYCKTDCYCKEMVKRRLLRNDTRLLDITVLWTQFWFAAAKCATGSLSESLTLVKPISF